MYRFDLCLYSTQDHNNSQILVCPDDMDALSVSQFDRFYPKFTELLGVLMQTLPPCVIEESKFFDKLINGLVTLLKFVQTMSDIY